MTGSKGSRSTSVQCFWPADNLPLDIQQFFVQAEGQAVEFGFTWYQNLVSTVYPDDKGVRIYVLRQNGQPVAALPVRVITKRLGQQVESLSNYYTALYAPVVAPELTAFGLGVLITEIRNAHAPVRSFRFAPMDPQSTGYRILMDALRLSGLLPYQFFCFGNWYLPVKSDWSSYLRSREGMLRSTIKRMSKKFSAEGGTLELVLGGVNLDRGLAAYERVYASSWKQAEPYPKFVPSLIRICAERGWLRLGVAWLNGEPIAAQLWIVANGKASIYKLAYGEEYKAYAPGTLLTAMLMEHTIDNDQVVEVDYLIGDDPYKKTWMSQRRERWGIIAYYPRSVSGFFGLVVETVGRGLKPLFAQIKKLLTNIRKTENRP